MKIKLLFVLFLIFSLTGWTQNQDVTGSWEGELEVMGTKLNLLFHIKKDDLGFISTMDSPMQGALGIPIDQTKFENDSLVLSAPSLGIVYQAQLKKDLLKGVFKQSGMEFPLIMKRTNEKTIPLNRPQTPTPPYSYDTEDIKLKNPLEGNILAGTIAQPKDFDKSQPILVMITGSGAQNRDEEILGHKPFAVIADYFAKQGIATLRMDDRGIGGSSKGSENDTSYSFATDISSAVDFLTERGYTNVGLIGHSEGGMIAPITASLNNKVKFIILMAGPGIPIDELMVLQSYQASKLAGVKESKLEKEREEYTQVFGYLKNYQGEDLMNDFETFLNEHKFFDKQQRKDALKTLTTGWFQYFMKYYPDDYLSQIKIPVLAINGSKDFQVTPDENLSGIEQSLQKAGNTDYKIVKMEGLNHLFQTCETGFMDEYGKIEQTIAPQVLEMMSEWIWQLKKRD